VGDVKVDNSNSSQKRPGSRDSALSSRGDDPLLLLGHNIAPMSTSSSCLYHSHPPSGAMASLRRPSQAIQPGRAVQPGPRPPIPAVPSELERKRDVRKSKVDDAIKRRMSMRWARFHLSSMASTSDTDAILL
jgi:hypothetical protein